MLETICKVLFGALLGVVGTVLFFGSTVPQNIDDQPFEPAMISWQMVGEDEWLGTDMDTGCQYFKFRMRNGQEQVETRIGNDHLPLCSGDQQDQPIEPIQ